MYLCIDAGNTRTKIAVFDDQGGLLETYVAPINQLEPIQSFIKPFSIEHVIISTTGQRDWPIADLDIHGVNIELSASTQLPVRIIYTTPDTLGHDRIAAACGSKALYPGKNCLIIDAGTCVTMDLLLEEGIYLGGNIAPGLYMRLQAMHDYTSKLPLVKPAWPGSSFGDSTEHALQNGAALGIVMEIEGIFQRAKNAFGDVIIVMTGGDTDFLADKVESRIFAQPELVAHGLFQILHFNVKNLY
jgi:type III pantothenate kinase